jgi:hypothetical protein
VCSSDLLYVTAEFGAQVAVSFNLCCLTFETPSNIGLATVL